MLRQTALGLMLAMGQLLLGAVSLSAQPIDEWHYIDDASVLHTQGVDGLHGAGVIQSDKLFAMLYLGVPEENGLVSVVLPSGDAATELSSTLVATNGQRFKRMLQTEELDIAEVGEGIYAYSFPISANDVDLFKAARSWQLGIGDRKWTVTLTGSRKAITEAERQFTEMMEQAQVATDASVTRDVTD